MIRILSKPFWSKANFQWNACNQHSFNQVAAQFQLRLLWKPLSLEWSVFNLKRFWVSHRSETTSAQTSKCLFWSLENSKTKKASQQKLSALTLLVLSNLLSNLLILASLLMVNLLKRLSVIKRMTAEMLNCLSQQPKVVFTFLELRHSNQI